jgi:hypothetical protein
MNRICGVKTQAKEQRKDDRAGCVLVQLHVQDCSETKIRANGNYILECLLFQVRRFAFCAVFRKLKVAFFALLSWKSVEVTVTDAWKTVP